MFPLYHDPAERHALTTIALIAAAEIVLLFCVSFHIAGGHFMLPLDDAYIHLQYAKMLAAGQPLVYTVGDLPSGGMTSPLFVLLLAPMFLVGLSGAKAAFGSFLFGGFLWIIANLWTHQIARRLSGDAIAWAASFLMLANGHLLWNFMAGMEAGLTATLLLGLVAASLGWWQDERPLSRLLMFAFAALLPLARPEGIVAILALGLVVLVRRGERPRLSLVSLGLCALPLVVWLLILRAATGEWRPAGMIVKSLTGAPVVTWGEKIGFMAQSLWAVPGKFLFNVVPDDGWAQFVGTSALPYFPVGFGLLVLLGFGMMAAGEMRGGKPGAGLLIGLLWLGLIGAVCTGLFPFVHHQRYLAPVTPLAILMGVAALRRIAQVFQQLENATRRALVMVLVLTSIPSVPWWMAEHGRNGRDLYNLLREATFRLQADDAPLAITDAGLVAFHTNRRTVDLVGLTTARFARATLHGDGATLEILSRIPHSDRPAEVLTYRPWFGPEFPIGDPIWTLTIPRTTSAWGTTLGLYPIKWDEVDRGKLPPVLAKGHRPILRLDVADLESESIAKYEARHRSGDVGRDLLANGLGPSVRMVGNEAHTTTATLHLMPLVDGGRTVRGESFVLASETLPRGPISLIGRVAAPRNLAAPPPVSLRLTVTALATGQQAQRSIPFPTELVPFHTWELGRILDEVGGVLPPQGGRWRIDLSPENQPDAAWTSCQWWVIEGPR